MTMRRTLLVTALAVLVSSCGFTPLYAKRGVVPGLSSIEVEAPQTRTGYLLREELDDAFARNRGEPPAYRLALRVNEDRRPRGLRVDDVATRYEVLLEVDYVLTGSAAGTTPLTQGRAAVSVTYDSADQPYAGVAAQTDGQERAAQQAAQRIRLDLARWFATRPQPPAAPR
jgi:LPS-assembly lipoprotein